MAAIPHHTKLAVRLKDKDQILEPLLSQLPITDTLSSVTLEPLSYDMPEEDVNPLNLEIHTSYQDEVSIG
jgi:hypothetical protein